MQYISPLHFIALSPADTIDRKDLLLAKKKMLAELELNEGRSLEINGQEVSKNDIIRLFDDLQQSADLAWHLEVYKDKVLLRFLEHNLLERNDRFASNLLYTDEIFINWVGPYYAHSFTSFADESLQQLTIDDWVTLLGNPRLMNGYQAEAAWEKIEKGMRLNIERLQFAEQRQVTRFTLEDLSGIVDSRYMQMLELLPEDRFGHIRDEMAFTMMQFYIKIFNHVDRALATTQMQQVHALAVSEEVRGQVYDKQLEMKTLRSQDRKFWKPKFQWNNSRLLIFVAFIALRAITCNMNNSNNNYRPAINYQLQPATSRDSILDQFRERVKHNDTTLSDTAPRKTLQDLLKQHKN